MTYKEMLQVVTNELNMASVLTKSEIEALLSIADANGDGAHSKVSYQIALVVLTCSCCTAGVVDIKEFTDSVAPKLHHIFEERKGSSDWVALTNYEPDGKEFLYW